MNDDNLTIIYFYLKLKNKILVVAVATYLVAVRLVVPFLLRIPMAGIEEPDGGTCYLAFIIICTVTTINNTTGKARIPDPPIHIFSSQVASSLLL